MDKINKLARETQLTANQITELMQLTGNDAKKVRRLSAFIQRQTGVARYEIENKVNESQKTDALPTEFITDWRTVPFSEIEALVEKQKEHGLMKQDENEHCSICLCDLQDGEALVKLSKCTDHFFHSDCIELCRGFNDYVKCPICGISYGVITGDMPPGRMQVAVYGPGNLPCDTYEQFGTYVITYEFPNGVREGVPYQGTRRTALLPANEDGTEVLNLLLLCFERRLTFTIGTSVTTGKSNQVIWNGVHHKTSNNGGPAAFGYPDSTYFNRVKEELAAKGIVGRNAINNG